MSDVKLYELGNARDILDQWLAEHEGELLPELDTLLEDLDCAITEKAERVALYILECEANAEACRGEAKRLTARAATKGNRADFLRGYLQRELARLDKKSIDGDKLTITRQRNSVVNIKCADPLLAVLQMQADPAYAVLPAPIVERRESAPTYHLNRDEITRRFKSGQPLPPAIVVEQGEHLRIR